MEFQANFAATVDTTNLQRTSKKASTLATSKSQPDIRTVYISSSDGVDVGQMHFKKVRMTQGFMLELLCVWGEDSV